MVTARRLTAMAVVAWTLSPGAASAQRSPFDDVQLEVAPETNGVAPYPHELVLLRITGLYRPMIQIEKLLQPTLPNFGWMELGKDRAFKAEFRGFDVRGFERVIAVFPEKSGQLTIPSFTHHITFVDGLGSRIIDVRSAPVTLDVAAWTGPGGPDDRTAWWLPARKLQLTDEWSIDPDHVPRGETTRRTVTIEADGVTADRLPPPPIMRSPGVISFAGPTDRETRIGPRGPIARVVYRWDMRPISAFPATVTEMKIPWFDTTARTSRDAIMPSRRMAWAVAPGEPGAEPQAPRRADAWQIAGAGGLTFLLGLGALLLGAGGVSLPKPAPAELGRLARAARRGHASEARAAFEALLRREPALAARWRCAPGVRAGLAALDRSLYAPSGGPAPDLTAFARAVKQARRAALAERRGVAASALAPLDGPLPGRR
jgi:hypothetical protein